MKRWLFALSLAGLVALFGCSRYTPKETQAVKGPAPEESTERETSGIKVIEGAGPNGDKTISIRIVDEDDPALPGCTPVKVRGIYISGLMAGNTDELYRILDSAAGTQINTVVIDLKDDEGRMTCQMDTPLVTEIGACRPYIKDIEGLISSLKERGLYVIARIVAFRDPYLAEKKPEWALTMEDGTLYRDRQGMTWANPYKKEVWDYLAEIGAGASKLGFDEVQFDYIRFPTDGNIKSVVFCEDSTDCRKKTDVITEFVQYEYESLAPLGLFVSADVFGTIIGSGIDAEAVGQIYTEMAKHLDYICPMIYPSHYGDGNFGIEHPDMEPYRTILAALEQSREVLKEAQKADREAHQAIVRPWLQDFTASYLTHYIPYGNDEVAAQIRAVTDAGYDEWMLWSAANRYHFGGVPAKEAEE